MESSSQLTELQLAILDVLWDQGEATSGEVKDALAPERALALTTVATLLSRLERRGWLQVRREGRRHVYSASVTREDVQTSRVTTLREVLFAGDPAELVNHLVQARDVDTSDLDRIQDMIDQARNRLDGDHG